jgi:chromosome segregation ATPase
MGNTTLAVALTLSILEITLLFFGAIILGITIHFTIASRRSLRSSMNDKDEVNKSRDEWKLRYFNDIEARDKELASVKEQLTEAEENTNIYSIEAEEMRKENKKLLEEINNTPKYVPPPTPVASTPSSEKPDYLDQLRMAQSSLMEHNDKINQLLENIDAFKDKEEKQREALRNNEELASQIANLRIKLAEKDKEISTIKQKEHLTKEMTSMLDNAYNEFNVLQGKMQKLEVQVSSSRMINMEYEDLKESHRKMSREFEEQKMKITSLTSESQQMHAQLMETEEKLRESNFHRQQMQKRVAYLEELNSDLHAVSDANKKLEGQLKRIGELESMLNITADEKTHLLRRNEK